MKNNTTLRGRPREFDIDQALDLALKVFWQKGYEGASLSELTKAMGINRPSLYAAFGDKETLFRKALERYDTGPAAYGPVALAEPTARAVVEKLWRGAVELQTNPCNPQGCLVVQGALSCSEAGDPIREALKARRAEGEAALKERFEQAKIAGDLPASTDASQLARYAFTIIYGMAVQAASGATRAELHQVVDLALQSWPS